jgi:hypothetical protein
MVTVADIRQTIVPLRLVFWGGLICVINIYVNGFDIVNDFIGAILILVGVRRLARIPVDERYRKRMIFVCVMAWSACATTFLGNFHIRWPEPATWLLLLLFPVQLAAVTVFCTAMRLLSADALMMKSARSWGITTVLVTVVYVIPITMLTVAAALGGRGNINFSGGWTMLIAIIVLLVPAIHFFVSTSRMKREAMHAAIAARPGDGIGLKVYQIPPNFPPSGPPAPQAGNP